jgi:ABC-type nitrate/sulfonate/bicarbonate transport system substrate-binding protein
MKLVLILIVALATQSCSKHPASFRIGIIQPSINHFPLTLAYERGQLKGCELIRFTSGWEAQEALAHRRIDCAIMPFTYAWTARSKGWPVRIVSFFEHETDGILVRPGIDSLTALNGKRIGVLRASTLDALTRLAAKRHGLSYLPVFFRTPNEILAALRSGDIDAGVAYVPLIQKMELEFRVLHWFGDDDPKHPCCDLCVNETTMKTNRKRVEELVAVLDNLTLEIEANPRAFIPDLCRQYRLSETQAADAFRHTVFNTGLNESGKAFEREIALILLREGYLEKLPDDGLYSPITASRGAR